ncbi:acyltransferase family protein [Chelatococcus reniformis]|nr:acyltransferase [Chelatococcus reniformis]
MDRPSPASSLTTSSRKHAQAPRLPAAGLGKVDALQYLRALAALMVVFYHAGHYLIGHRQGPDLQGFFDGRLALHGVAIFFALSGYLMAELALRSGPERFLLHRLTRIYPIYLICTAAFCALSPLIIGSAYTPRLLATTLIPIGSASYALGIEWTLLFEVTFYVFVFLVIWAGAARALAAIGLAWLALVVASLWLLPRPDVATLTPPLYLLPFNAANGAFACGLLVPTLMRHVRVPWPAALAPLAALAVSGYFDLAENRVIAGVTSAALIASALSWRVETLPAALQRAMLKLGDASYAIYLVHVPVIVAAYRWLPEVVPLGPAWAVASALAVAVGLAVGRLDIGLYRRLKRWADGLRAPQARAFVGAYIAAFVVIASYGSVVNLIESRDTAAAAAALDGLGPVTDAATVAAAIARKGAGFAAPAGEVEQVATLPDERLAIAGWALDREAPKTTTFIAVFCEGRQIAWAKRQRLRPAAADTLGMPGLRKVRVGFTLASEPRRPCPGGGQPVVVAADVRGKAWVVPYRGARP